MSSRLLFPDATVAGDALTFAQRASRVDDGTLRLRATDGVLAMSAAALAPQTLLDETPTVLAMRFLSVDPELVCDLVVDAAGLAADPADARALQLPETAVTAPWAGVSPPRGGWVEESRVSAATLASRAQWGIAAVAQALPPSAGEDVVRGVRSRVWSPPDDELRGLPLGVAFAAFALGFIGGEEEAVVRRSGPWARLSLSRGHVLTRTTVRSGMTAVRVTGGS